MTTGITGSPALTNDSARSHVPGPGPKTRAAAVAENATRSACLLLAHSFALYVFEQSTSEVNKSVSVLSHPTGRALVGDRTLLPFGEFPHSGDEPGGRVAVAVGGPQKRLGVMIDPRSSRAQ